ncbi:hypothetical protein Tco_0715198 [Tanacetum coccineum]
MSTLDTSNNTPSERLLILSQSRDALYGHYSSRVSELLIGFRTERVGGSKEVLRVTGYSVWGNRRLVCDLDSEGGLISRGLTVVLEMGYRAEDGDGCMRHRGMDGEGMQWEKRIDGELGGMSWGQRSGVAIRWDGGEY